MGHLDYFLEGLSEKDIEWMISKGKVYIFRSGHALIKENWLGILNFPVASIRRYVWFWQEDCGKH